MCLFSTIYQSIPGCPLLILSNREEERARPAKSPRIVTETGKSWRWLGGMDSRAGGTWLGINQVGMLVAMTNRAKRNTPLHVRSRGLLCRDLLGCRSPNEAIEELNKQQQRHSYAGFNVLLLSIQESVVIESGDDDAVKSPPPGIHTIANGTLDDPDDPRVSRARSELSQWQLENSSLTELVDDGKRICRLGADANLPGICVRNGNYGTVSSTILALTDDPQDAQYWYAAGPPTEVPYTDYSADLRNLLIASPQALN